MVFLLPRFRHAPRTLQSAGHREFRVRNHSELSMPQPRGNVKGFAVFCGTLAGVAVHATTGCRRHAHWTPRPRKQAQCHRKSARDVGRTAGLSANLSSASSARRSRRHAVPGRAISLALGASEAAGARSDVTKR